MAKQHFAHEITSTHQGKNIYVDVQKLNIARIPNAVQLHSILSGHYDCQEYSFITHPFHPLYLFFSIFMFIGNFGHLGHNDHHHGLNGHHSDQYPHLPESYQLSLH